MKKKVYSVKKECICCGKIESYYYKTVTKNSKMKSYKCISCYEELVKVGNKIAIKKQPVDYINMWGY